MKLTNEQKKELRDVVAMSFETGHFSFDNFEDFKRNLREFENLTSDVADEAWEYYCELVNFGPAGFYEEFKDEYDFDPLFVAEYAPYYEDDEDPKFVVRFDIDGQNMDEFFYDKEEAITYAKDNLDCLPTIYEIDEETGIENFCMAFEEDE